VTMSKKRGTLVDIEDHNLLMSGAMQHRRVPLDLQGSHTTTRLIPELYHEHRMRMFQENAIRLAGDDEMDVTIIATIPSP